jgi:hypothetical protein
VGAKGGCADDIQGGDTEEAGRFEDTGFAKRLGGYGDGGVDRVGNDTADGLGTGFGDLGEDIADDAGVGLAGMKSKICYETNNRGHVCLRALTLKRSR